MYAIGYDIGSSSVKASIVKIDSGHVVAIGKYPESEMHMEAKHPGWAEQDPEMWWESICILTKTLLSENNIDANQILSIGIGYQMHGLVLVDKNHQSQSGLPSYGAIVGQLRSGDQAFSRSGQCILSWDICSIHQETSLLPNSNG
jgi:sugar (pentulose or hexulose) kinase